MEEDRIYTISTGMKIFYALLGAFLLGFSIFLLSMGKGRDVNPAVYILPLLIFTGSILIFVNLFKKQVIISNTGITNINVFQKREISFANIKGCRIGQKFISIEPISSTDKKVTIGNYIDLGDSEQLAAWVKENFADLDAIDFDKDQKQVLEDTNLGFTKEDREAKLKKAKQVAAIYNVAGFGGSMLLLFLVSPYAVVIMGLIYPLLSIIIMKFSSGLIKFVGNSKRSVNPFILIGFMGPVMFMFFISLDEYQIFQYDNLWLIIIVVIAILTALIYFTGLNNSIGGIKGQIFAMFLFASMYAFGGVMSANCAFDKTQPTVYKATVIDHRVETGKHTSYLLTLSEWGPMNKQKEEDVGKRLYYQTNIGDTVHVHFKKGLFNAPWYQVKLN